jgi:hypothetical protein
MAYVDLNPIRAKIASTLETSKHTSIQKRSKAVKQKRRQPRHMCNPKQLMPKGIAFSLKDYCELVDTTGRCVREDKAGHMTHSHSPILARLGLNSEQWLTLTTEFEKHFCYAAGAEQMMCEFKAHTGH